MKNTLPPISELSYYRTGGTCLQLHEPTTISELCDVRKKIASSRESFFILGAGSNSLVMDNNWHGHVISLRKLSKWTLKDSSTLECEAGVLNDDVSIAAFENGFANLAWMHKLPGQVGATIRMNARCYGGEVSQVVTKIESVDPEGRLVIFYPQKDTSVFSGYKDTVFMTNGHIVARVCFSLEKGDRSATHEKMKYYSQDRASKGQFLFPSCGCVFKNNYKVGVPSGMLLEAAGVYNLKCFDPTSVSINPQHANFIFNHKKSNSWEILELSLNMRELVFEKLGIWLEYEMEVLGSLPADLKCRFYEKRDESWNLKEIEILKKRFSARNSK